jgi:hypothetical protein
VRRSSGSSRDCREHGCPGRTDTCVGQPRLCVTSAGACEGYGEAPRTRVPGVVRFRYMADERFPVGTLDDPIWTEPVNSQLPGSNEGPLGSRITPLVVGLVIVVGLGLFGYWVVQPDHPGGDPGGSIMQSLKQPLQSALPIGAHITGVSYQEPRWTDRCGWSEVFTTYSFNSGQSRADIVSHATSVLTAAGWSAMSYTGTNGGPATWTHEVAQGSVKRIDLASTPTIRSGVYSLSAAAPPQGGKTNCAA